MTAAVLTEVVLLDVSTIISAQPESTFIKDQHQGPLDLSSFGSGWYVGFWWSSWLWLVSLFLVIQLVLVGPGDPIGSGWTIWLWLVLLIRLVLVVQLVGFGW